MFKQCVIEKLKLDHRSQVLSLGSWPWNFGHRFQVVGPGFGSWFSDSGSCFLDPWSQLPGHGSLIPVRSVVNTKCDKKLLQSLTGIIKCDNYYKVWKKDLAKCDRYYKMQQALQKVTENY